MVIVDASLVSALALKDSRASAVIVQFRLWARNSEQMHAPALLPYEVASALTRATAMGAFPRQMVSAAWQSLLALPITYHDLSEGGDAVLAIATRLRRHSAYDASYLALAQELSCDFWTFDASLARNARALGYRVRLLPHS